MKPKCGGHSEDRKQSSLSVCVLNCVAESDSLWPLALGCRLPGSSVRGVSQERILEWVAISSSRGSSQPRPVSCISFTAGRLFTTELSGKPYISSRYKTACDKLNEKQPLLEMFLNFSRERKVSM